MVKMYYIHVINPRRACTARVTVLSVCLSVTTFSATARNNAPNKIYQRLQRDMSKVLKVPFSLKMLGSEVMASFAYAAVSSAVAATLSFFFR